MLWKLFEAYLDFGEILTIAMKSGVVHKRASLGNGDGVVHKIIYNGVPFGHQGRCRRVAGKTNPLYLGRVPLKRVIQGNRRGAVLENFVVGHV